MMKAPISQSETRNTTSLIFGHSHGPRLGENVSVNMHHQVASRRVLHDKTNVFLRLEARKQVDQEWVADAVDRFENPLLAHQTGRREEETV